MSALAEAAHLARAGRYDEARRALEALGGATSDDVAVLDLLARVHAQQGDLTAADECWARVESLDPEHTGAREGRRRIRAVWGRRRGVGAGTAGLAAVLLLAGGAAAGWALAPGADGASSPATQTTAPQDPGLAEAVDRLEHELDRLGDRTGQRDEGERVRRLVAALDDPRWTARADGGAVTVVFREGVFAAGGAEATDAGREALGGLGAALRGQDVAVAVVGHTSDTPPVPGGPGNAAVGLDRALAGAQVLAVAADLPLGAVRVATSGDAAPPHPNTDEAGRARNQTVTVTLTPRRRAP